MFPFLQRDTHYGPEPPTDLCCECQSQRLSHPRPHLREKRGMGKKVGGGGGGERGRELTPCLTAPHHPPTPPTHPPQGGYWPSVWRPTYGTPGPVDLMTIIPRRKATGGAHARLGNNIFMPAWECDLATEQHRQRITASWLRWG